MGFRMPKSWVASGAEEWETQEYTQNTKTRIVPGHEKIWARFGKTKATMKLGQENRRSENGLKLHGDMRRNVVGAIGPKR